MFLLYFLDIWWRFPAKHSYYLLQQLPVKLKTTRIRRFHEFKNGEFKRFSPVFSPESGVINGGFRGD
jgi:hypothetical protein